MGERRPTIHDVASRAGVSIKTVSRVINGEPHVSAAMRAKVDASVAELSYRPNPAAQGLRRATSRSIALVCEDITEPFASELVLAVEHAVGNRFTVIVASTLMDAAREREILESLAARQVDGVILAPSPSPKNYLKRILGRTALVCVDRLANGLRTDAVLSDNVEGMSAAVGHLVSLGHRRIAYIGDDASGYTQTERLEGYVRTLREAGVDYDPRLVYQEVPDRQRIRAHLDWLAKTPSPPTAFVSGNSLTTLEMIHAGFDAGSPAFVGFDDFPLADVVFGGVNVVAQDAGSLGAEATETLLRRMGSDAAPVKTSRIATRLIIRQPV